MSRVWGPEGPGVQSPRGPFRGTRATFFAKKRGRLGLGIREFSSSDKFVSFQSQKQSDHLGAPSLDGAESMATCPQGREFRV